MQPLSVFWCGLSIENLLWEAVQMLIDRQFIVKYDRDRNYRVLK